MKSFIITEQQIVDCFKLGEANDPAGLLKLTATLPEHTPVTPEAEPEAPKDWSEHPDYGECRRCEHEGIGADKDPCCACCLEFRETGQSPYWQPRTP